MALTKEEIEKLKAEGRWTTLEPDPKLKNRTGYELAARWSSNALARRGAKVVEKRNFSEGQKENALIQKLKRDRAYSKPATARQLEVLVKFGVDIPENCTLKQASLLITTALQQFRLGKK